MSYCTLSWTLVSLYTNQGLHFCAHSNTVLKHSSEGDGVGKGEADQTGINSWGESRRDNAVEGIRDWNITHHVVDSTHFLLRGWQRKTLQ